MLTGLNIDEYFQRADSSGTLSYLTDMLGSTMALADSSGALETTYTYDPFGNVTVNGADTNPYQFTGRENDDTGLYFYRARYYSPKLQRFISQDPIGFRGGGADLYAYAYNSPTELVDPLGLYTFDQLEQVVNSSFNETRSLSGSSLSQALYDIDQVDANLLANGKWMGEPYTAKPTVSHVSDGEIGNYQACLDAAEKAQFDRKEGIDPTHGATHYYEQSYPNKPTPYPDDPRYQVQTSSGPLNNSFPNADVPVTRGVFVNTYTGP